MNFLSTNGTRLLAAWTAITASIGLLSLAPAQGKDLSGDDQAFFREVWDNALASEDLKTALAKSGCPSHEPQPATGAFMVGLRQAVEGEAIPFNFYNLQQDSRKIRELACRTYARFDPIGADESQKKDRETDIEKFLYGNPVGFKQFLSKLDKLERAQSTEGIERLSVEAIRREFEKEAGMVTDATKLYRKSDKAEWDEIKKKFRDVLEARKKSAATSSTLSPEERQRYLQRFEKTLQALESSTPLDVPKLVDNYQSLLVGSFYASGKKTSPVSFMPPRIADLYCCMKGYYFGMNQVDRAMNLSDLKGGALRCMQSREIGSKQGQQACKKECPKGITYTHGACYINGFLEGINECGTHEEKFCPQMVSPHNGKPNTSSGIESHTPQGTSGGTSAQPATSIKEEHQH